MESIADINIVFFVFINHFHSKFKRIIFTKEMLGVM